MGGMAVRAHAPRWPARTRRTEVDLDFATTSKDRSAIYKLLEAEGYTPDRQQNALFGQKQAYFVDVARSRPVDVLVDALEMCHRIEFGNRLSKSRPTLPLAELLLSKLQVVKINRKDVLDALILLAEHPLGRTMTASTPSMVPGPSTCRGSCQHHLERLGLVADRHRQPRQARPVPRDRAARRRTWTSATAVAIQFDPGAQIAALRAGIERGPEVDPLEAPRAGRRRARRGTRSPRRWGTNGCAIFFATDIHGSEVCWRKFLNAGTFHKADVLVMGGDMTGKAMVPIVSRNGGWNLRLQDQDYVLTTEDEVKAMEKRIADRGYYPIRLTDDEVAAWESDPALVDTRFKAEMVGMVERWMALADERLKGKGIRCVVSPANDDIFELDPIIAAAELVDLGEQNTIELDGFTMVSTGWANPTPWNTFRELPEDQLRSRIDELLADVPDKRRAIFNFHAPPYGSNLDNAPKLDADMRYVSGGQALVPVGSHAVRDAIVEYGPVLSLHGHIHEGRGAVKIGRTLAVNPGSTYEDGVLQAAIVDLDPKKGEVKRYLLING